MRTVSAVRFLFGERRRVEVVYGESAFERRTSSTTMGRDFGREVLDPWR